MKRLLCTLTALALCAGVFAPAAHAATTAPAASSAAAVEDGAGSGPAQSTPADAPGEDTVPPAAAIANSMAPQTMVTTADDGMDDTGSATDGMDDSGSGGDMGSGSGSGSGSGDGNDMEPVSDNSLGAYIVSATATDASSGELTAILPGQVFNIVVTVADPVTDGGQLQDDFNARGDKTAEDFISARLTSPSFLHTGPAEVSPFGGSDQPLLVGGYYRYTLIFRDVLYLGNGNTFSFDVSYPTSVQEWRQLSFTVGQCQEPEDSSDGSSTDGNRTPHLMVRSSSYGNTAINAGQAFTLSVTVYATNGNESLADVTVTLDLRSEGITLQSGTLSKYLGTMKANSTQEVQFVILPSISFTDGVADIGVTLQGFGANTGTESDGNVSISVPIEQPDRFEITSTEISDTIYLGEGGSLAINFVNKGRNPISNLEASITGNNLGVDLPQQYLGNVAAGTESSVDFDLLPPEAGPVNGVVTLTYEAADGSVKTLTQEFSAEAIAMDFGGEEPGFTPDEMPPEEPSAGFPLWGKLLIGAGVAGAAVAGVVLVRRRRKKKKALASLESEDEDF